MSLLDRPKHIVLTLAAAIKGLRLYPPQHPEIRRQISSLQSHLTDMLLSLPKVRIGLLDGALIVEDQLFVDDNPAAEDIARLFNAIHLKGLEFSRGIQETELATLVMTLQQSGIDAQGLTTQLRNAGVQHIRVLPAKEEDSPKSPRQVYGKALKVVDDIFQDVRLGRIPSTKEAKTVVQSMVRLTLTDPHALFALSMLKDYDNYTFTHSVNVSVLSLAVGRACNVQEEQLRILGLGGLLHDLGKLKVNVNIITKPGKLTEEEFTQIKTHPVTGAEIVKQMEGITSEVIDIVYGHHLRYDRTGYPEASRGRRFSPLTDMTAIADTYDAITTLRSYQKPVTPRLAIRKLEELSGSVLNPEMVRRFIASLGRYPVGTLVRLDTNEIALVTRVGATVSDDVQLKILYDDNGEELREHPRLELTGKSRMRIIAEVDPGIKGIDVADFFDVE